MAYPWFRFYSETLSDRKIEYLRRTTGQPKALVIGVWTTFLALASDSPVRGALLLTDDIPLTEHDLVRETGLQLQEVKNLLHHLISLKMMDLQAGIYYILNWDRRQFSSDNSTERVRRWREKQDENGDDCDVGNVSDGEGGNDSETLRERSGNTPDTDTDTEADTERKDIAPKTRRKSPKPPPESEQQAKKREPTGRNAVKAALETHFMAVSCLDAPAIGTPAERKAAGKFWWKPLLAIATLVDDDVEQAKHLIDHTLSVMDLNGWSVSSPASILKTAKSQHAKQLRGATASANNSRVAPNVQRLNRSLAVAREIIEKERDKEWQQKQH